MRIRYTKRKISVSDFVYEERLEKMLKRRLPIGIEDYKEMIEWEYYYIDKTLFIKELLDSKSKVTLITRPRRFGKNLGLSTVQTFFEDAREKTEIK